MICSCVAYNMWNMPRAVILKYLFSIVICCCSYGSFFGPSQPVIAQRVIQESKSLLENRHLVPKPSNTHQTVCIQHLFFSAFLLILFYQSIVISSIFISSFDYFILWKFLNVILYWALLRLGVSRWWTQVNILYSYDTHISCIW